MSFLETASAIYVGEKVLGLIAVFIVFAIILSLWLSDFVKQCLCKHISYYENSSCDAICRRCHKNLGFIGRLESKKSIRAATILCRDKELNNADETRERSS